MRDGGRDDCPWSRNNDRHSGCSVMFPSVRLYTCIRRFSSQPSKYTRSSIEDERVTARCVRQTVSDSERKEGPGERTRIVGGETLRRGNEERTGEKRAEIENRSETREGRKKRRE